MPVTVIGDEALAAKLRAAAAQINARAPYWVRDAGTIMLESITEDIQVQGLIGEEDNTPYRHPHLAETGRLFNQTARGINVGFGKGHPAAAALEYGAAAHVIEARNPAEKMLYFYWENEGRYFYGPAVYHPGNRPYRFMYRGAMKSVFPICLFFMDELRDVFGGF